MLADHDRLRQCRHHPLRHRFGDAGVGKTFEQQRELVSAETGDEIARSHGLAEASGHDAEQLVAGGVAQGVVHILEVVEVHEQHGLAATAMIRPGQHGLQPGTERGPVGQSAERVGGRLHGQDALTVGDGVGHGVEADGEIADLVGPVDLDTVVELARRQVVGRVAQDPDRADDLGGEASGQAHHQDDGEQLEHAQEGHDPAFELGGFGQVHPHRGAAGRTGFVEQSEHRRRTRRHQHAARRQRGLSAHRTTAVDHRLPDSHGLVEQRDDGGLVLLGDGEGEAVADGGLERTHLTSLIDRDLTGEDDGVGDHIGAQLSAGRGVALHLHRRVVEVLDEHAGAEESADRAEDDDGGEHSEGPVPPGAQAGWCERGGGRSRPGGAWVRCSSQGDCRR